MASPITARFFFITTTLLVFFFLAFGPSGYYDAEDESDTTKYKAAVKRHKQTNAHPQDIKGKKQRQQSKRGHAKEIEHLKTNKEKILQMFQDEQQAQQKRQHQHPPKNTPPRKKPSPVADLTIDSSSGDQANLENSSANPPPSDDTDSHYSHKQTVDAEGNPLPFAVYESTEDHIPEETSKIASEKLECRQSVIEFVINATDVKDECEGLRKAFDASCAIGEGGEAGSASVFSQNNRRLSAADTTSETADGVMLGQKKAVFYRGLFSIHDEMSEYVASAVDYLFSPRRKMQIQQPQEQPPLDEEGAQLKPGEDDAPIETNKEKEKGKEHKPSLISVPTSKGHIGNHMFTDTLLFKEGTIGLASQPTKEGPNDNDNNDGSTSMIDKMMGKKGRARGKTNEDDPSPKTSSGGNALVFTPEAEELKTCCASIMNVFHEHCDRTEDEELNDGKLIIIVSVIAMCSLVKSLIRHFEIRWLPEAAGCILVGVVGGMIMETIPHLDVGFDEKLFLRVMLPPIVFEAALNIDKRSFQRHAFPIFLYAVMGTILSTILVAIIIHNLSASVTSCLTVPFTESLLFGALISSIDPIAVLSILSNMGMRDTDTIYVLIFGESLLNDGVAIVLFDTLVHFLDETLVLDAVAVWDAMTHFMVVALGSVFFGMLSGACCTMYFWLMHGCQSPLVEVMAFVCWALIPYYVCDNVRWSGIVAIVAAGIVMDLYVVGHKANKRAYDGHGPISGLDISCQTNPSPDSRRRVRALFNREGHMSPTAKTHIGFVTEIISTLMETAIFAYLGLFLFNSRYHWSFYLSLIAISSCILSRGVMIAVLSFIANTIEKIRRQSRKDTRETQDGICSNKSNPNESEVSSIIIDKRMQLVLLFAGLRGAVSFALVEAIPMYDSTTGHGTRYKPELKSMTSASIIFTVFCLGGSTFYLLQRLGISLKKEASIEMSSLLSTNGSSPGLGNKMSDEEMMGDQIVRQRGSGNGSL